MQGAAKPGPAQAIAPAQAPSLWGHLQIARFDHWIKNVFVLPGIVVALSMDHSRVSAELWKTVPLGLLAVGLIASSNYTLNELLDAPHDREHPTKRFRPVPSGRVNVGLAWAQWLLLLAAGLGLAWLVSLPFTLTLLGLWVMGCAYNIPPIRTKDVPYLNVVSEAVNNPLRMMAGWFLTGTAAVIPVSLLISYWMIGCYFMAIKRWAEYRNIGSATTSAAYRKSFAYYDDRRLLISIMFYGSDAMLFFGAFIMRYRMELILSFPLLALVMAVYLSLGFKRESAAEHPEKLYREPALMAAVVACSVVMIVLLFVNVPLLHRIFVPTPIR